MARIDFLGYEVSKDGIKPGEFKIEAVRKFKSPSNVHEIRQFIRLASYFRKFIKNFALIARPLTMLTKKGQPWLWTIEQKQAFETIKQLLTDRPVLALYDRTLETELHTDASKWGLGGVLMQRQKNNQLQPVAYFSRQTTKEEQRYHSYELETLAVISSLHRYRVYLIGIKFKIVSDCSALRATFAKRDLAQRIGRWWIQLQEYDCVIEYRAGSKMSHVDALSRNAIEDLINAEGIKEIGIYQIEHDDRLLLAQLQDKRLKYINEVLDREPRDKEERELGKEYARKNRRIYKVTENGLRWAVPRAMRREIVRMCHDEMGHVALDKTIAKIRNDYWFPQMRRYVKGYITACIQCFYNKESGGKKSGFLHPIEKIPEPMHTIHVDHLGPFVKSTVGNSYLLVAVDAFTKYVFMKAVPNTKAMLVERFLDEIGSNFGYPFRIISDRGSAFTSRKFKEYCEALNIKHVLTAVATPRANGQVERYNRTILAALTTSITDERKWNREVNKVRWGLNNTVNGSTGKSPSELLLGYRPRSRVEVNILNDVGETSLGENRDSTHKRASKTIEGNQAKMKARYDLRRAPPRVFKQGDAVGIRRVIASNDGASKKLLPKYSGPYEVKEVLGADRYLVGDIAGCQRSQKPYSGVYPGEKLKVWETAISSDESDDALGDDDAEDGN